MKDKAMFVLTDEHIKLLTNLNLSVSLYTDEEPYALPDVNHKRIFGNTSSWTEVASLLNITPERTYTQEELRSGKDEKEGYPYGFSPKQIMYCNLKLAELCPALTVVLQHHTFSPGNYEIAATGAYFHFVRARNYLLLRPFIEKIERSTNEELPRLHEVAMNLHCDDADVFKVYLEHLSFGDETTMRSRNIAWLNKAFDELHVLIGDCSA